MALTFPRDMTTAHNWQKADFELKFRQEHSQQADGTTIGKDLGSPLWHVDFETEPMEKSEAEALYADFLTLGGLARTFYAHTAGRPEPLGQVGAQLLGVEVLEISPDRREISLGGLPDSFILSGGDFLSIETSVGGFELHTLASSGSAGQNGQVLSLYLSHILRPSVSVGNVVSLRPPKVELRLKKDGLQKPKRISGNLYTISFEAIQEVR